MTPPQARPKWINWAGGTIAIAILAAALGPYLPQIAVRAGEVRFAGPDWALWARLPWVFQLHILSALTALLIGTVILLRPKGRGLHKTLGWCWVAAMGTTAVSSLFMTGLNGGFYSFIHILSGWTIIALPMAIFAIRRRKVETHRQAMTGIFVGGLLIAGGLTFIPGRFMFEFFLG
jgi:uncharacterized membrane protein